MKIGSFIQDRSGAFHGKIYGLGLGVTTVMFEPQVSKEGKNYFRMIGDPAKTAYEIGAAFLKEKDGRQFLSVLAESPMLPSPLNAALFPSKEDPEAFNLVWSRKDGQDLKLEATTKVKTKPVTRRFMVPRSTP